MFLRILIYEFSHSLTANNRKFSKLFKFYCIIFFTCVIFIFQSRKNILENVIKVLVECPWWKWIHLLCGGFDFGWNLRRHSKKIDFNLYIKFETCIINLTLLKLAWVCQHMIFENCYTFSYYRFCNKNLEHKKLQNSYKKK